MKIVFQAPPALAQIAAETFVPAKSPAGSVFFKPLSAPGLYEDRIDLTITSEHTTRRAYPYKRADESVN
jgi:hypothetical protein